MKKAEQDAENAMRCPICYERFRTPVLLARCAHMFCAFCIRQALHYKGECPICRHVASAGDIVSVRPFEQLASATSALLEILHPAEEKEQPEAKRRHVCTACGIDVAATRAADHAAECIANDATRDIFHHHHAPPPPPPQQQAAAAEKPMRRIPPVVYSLLKNSQLRNRCKELGLPTKGERAILERRHREYATRHNAECDAVNPRTVAEIIAEVLQLEDTIAQSSCTAQPAPQSPSAGHAFARLIQEVRNRPPKQPSD